MNNTGWICLEKLEVAFNVFDYPKLAFDDAITACEEEEGNLASIRSVDEFLGLIPIANSLEGLKNRGTDMWIGVKYALDSIDIDSAKLPANYMFIDGASNSYFNVSMGRFPWRDTNQIIHSMNV